MTWKEHPDNPLIRPPFGSPILADPTFLPPSETPDGRWHLFAHSLFGIHRFVSHDGVAWQRAGRTIVRNALRAFVYREGHTYWLFYEKCRLMLPILSIPWASHIEVRTSPDLVHWNAPRTVLRPSLPWHSEPRRGRAVGNPCVVPVAGRFRLYYSAGLVFLPDCGFCEPRHIAIAESGSLEGPYQPEPAPMLGAGAIKVVREDNTFLGFHNRIFSDEFGRSRSAIWLMHSGDGRTWTEAEPEPILKPTEGWKRSHVYALDVRRVDDRWVVFFNARDDWHWWKGREAIGRAEGCP